MTAQRALENVADAYPLSPLQEGMLFHVLAEPDSDMFMNQRSIDLDGELDLAAFRAAWERLVERHDVLRTAFLWEGLDRPLQVVRRSAPLEWHEHDWTHLTPEDQSDRFDLLLGNDMRRGFDLQAAPLTRMTVIRMGREKWRWLWTCYHFIADAWSVSVLLDELQAIYAELRGGPVADLPEPVAYRDFVASVLARNPAGDEHFWRARLAGFSAPHRLEVPGLPPDPDSRGHRVAIVELDEASSDALRSATAAEGVTLNSAVLAAWAVQLSRWTRETDVVFGATIAGRDVAVPGVDRGVGLFINTLPVRLAVDAKESVADLWRKAQRHQQESFPFEQSSLAAIQQWADGPAGDALFESIFVFGNQPASVATEKSGLIPTGVEFKEHSNYPLAILVDPGRRLRLRFIYDSARFADQAMESLADQTVHVLTQFAGDPGMPLAQLETLPTAEREQVRAYEAGPPLDPTEETIHELIGRAGAEQPEAAAVIFQDQVLTYGQLEEASTRVAVRLEAAGVGPNRPVGLYLRRSAEMIVGMLGILKAGGAYVPLDPDYPAGHIHRLLEEDEIDIVVTDAARRADLPAAISVVSIGASETDGASPARPEVPPGADDLAYVIHTSGSTGRPKGVMVTHRNLVQSTRARTVHYGRPVDRFLLLSSFAFDSSVAGIFWTLTTGGTLVLPSPGLEHDINRLIGLAAAEQVTHLLGLPALYEMMLERADDGELDSLRVAIVAGEACPPRVQAAHLDRLPETELHNEYGPTEATVWCTAHRAAEADQGTPLPIGRPIAGTTVHLLDEHGHRVPAGFVGELWVGGDGVTGGYLNRPDLTAERFASVRLDEDQRRLYRTGDLACYRASDNALLFLGRADVQLKIRGHRIEPGAVEEALRSHPAVAEATVSSRDTNGQGAAQLIGYAVFDGDAIDPRTLRDYLRDRLPPFMVPDVLVPLEALPRLANGKVDTAALPKPTVRSQSNPASGVLPQSEAEVALAAIWSEVLDVEQASVRADSDFFHLGGHSLMAIRVMSKIHAAFGVSPPLSALFDAPRLSEFAALLENGGPTHSSSLMVPIRRSGETTLYLIHPGGGNVLVYEPLARHLSDRVEVIGIQARGIDGKEEPDRTFDAMAQRYAEEIRKHAPRGPVNLAGYSTGGLIAFEVARILKHEGYEVGLVALLDTLFPPGPGLSAWLTRQREIVREAGWAGIRTVADWWWGSLRALAGRARHRPRWRYLLSRNRTLPPDLAAKRITHIALAAVRRHQPGPYPGAITYIRALGDGTRFNDSIPRWREVAQEVIVRDAPGQHAGEANMVSEHHASAMAAIIEERLTTAG